MQVRDVMTRMVVSVNEGDSILAAARLMLHNRISPTTWLFRWRIPAYLAKYGWM